MADITHDFEAWCARFIETARMMMHNGTMTAIVQPLEITPAFTGEQIRAGDVAEPKGKAPKRRDLTDDELRAYCEQIRVQIGPYLAGYMMAPLVETSNLGIVLSDSFQADSLGEIANAFAESDLDIYLYSITFYEVLNEGNPHRKLTVRCAGVPARSTLNLVDENNLSNI